jgi:hypothetical protein
MTLAQILDEVKTLTPQDRERLRQALETPDASTETQRAADEVERRLFEAGLLREIKQPIIDLAPYRDRKPIEYQGKPLSEVIVEERR